MAQTKAHAQPVATREEQRFLAFESLVQWTQAVIVQSARASDARDYLTRTVAAAAGAQLSSAAARHLAANERRLAIYRWQSECYFFAIAADNLLRYRDRALSFGLCASVDFSELAKFPAEHIRDLRNMLMHEIDYLEGRGAARPRWVIETADYRADAGSIVGTEIGGRLDWVEFGSAAQRLLARLLAEPIPYPPTKYPSG
jgi:hypothetical protein